METLKTYLKQQIKTLSALQKVYKNQRKTVYILGERTMTCSEARYTHSSNRLALYQMFLVYGTLRGKTIQQIEGKLEPQADQKYVDTLTEKYTKKFEDTCILVD